MAALSSVPLAGSLAHRAAPRAVTRSNLRCGIPVGREPPVVPIPCRTAGIAWDGFSTGDRNGRPDGLVPAS